MSRPMTEQERDTFLAEPHVAFLDDPDGTRPAHAIPLFYDYAPGSTLSLFTWNPHRTSRNAFVIQPKGAVRLTVRREECPDSYVAVQGTVVRRSQRPSAEEVYAIARRYSGDDEARGFTEMVLASAETDLIVFTVQPERWITGDAGEIDPLTG